MAILKVSLKKKLKKHIKRQKTLLITRTKKKLKGQRNYFYLAKEEMEKKTKHCQKHGIELHSTRRQTMKHKTTTPRGKKLEQQDKVYNGSQGSF